MRPKSPCPRSSRLVFRVYSLEKKAIELSASKSGLQVSDYLCRSALGQPLPARLSAEELQLYTLLVEYRNNFARISNLIKERQDLTAALKEVIEAIEDQLKKFSS